MVSVLRVTVSSRISVPEMEPVGRTTSASPVESVVRVMAVVEAATDYAAAAELKLYVQSSLWKPLLDDVSRLAAIKYHRPELTAVI